MVREEVLELTLDEVITLEVKYPWGVTPWNFNIGFPPISLPSWHFSWLYSTIKEWTKKWNETFPTENTFARKFGVPTFIARFDYATNEVKEEAFLYEIEPAPLGIGVGYLTNNPFRRKLDKLEWKNKTLVVVSSERIKGGDDHLWAEVVKENEWLDVRKEKRFIFFRGLKEKILSKWEERSITPPPQNQNSKQYGEGWLWEKVRRDELDRIYNIKINKEKWNGIVIKGPEGYGSRGVGICLPKHTRKEVEQWLGKRENIGIHGPRGALAKVVSEKDLYIQRFYLPNKVKVRIISSGEIVQCFGIWRIYLGYSFANGWEVLGGFFNLRPSLLIHGATDSISLIVEP